jgi:hypothetical protein
MAPRPLTYLSASHVATDMPAPVRAGNAQLWRNPPNVPPDGPCSPHRAHRSCRSEFTVRIVCSRTLASRHSCLRVEGHGVLGSEPWQGPTLRGPGSEASAFSCANEGEDAAARRRSRALTGPRGGSSSSSSACSASLLWNSSSAGFEFRGRDTSQPHQTAQSFVCPTPSISRAYCTSKAGERCSCRSFLPCI